MNRIAPLILTLTSLVSACATPSQEPPEPHGKARCHAEGLDDLVGQAATSALAEQAMKQATARTLRWIQPGSAVTMDYRFDRLDVHLDGTNLVTKFTCG